MVTICDRPAEADDRAVPDLSVHTRERLDAVAPNSTTDHTKRSTGKPQPSVCTNYSPPDQTVAPDLGDPRSSYRNVRWCDSVSAAAIRNRNQDPEYATSGA